MDCLELKINKHYKTWRSHARGLCRNNDEGDELLHTVLDSVLNSGQARAIACREERSESIEFYVNRAIWLRYFTEKRRNTRKIVYLEERVIEPPAEITDYHIEGEQVDVLIYWLTEYERELILAYSTKGFRFTDAAKQLGVSYSTLRIDLKNAIKTMKKYVQDSRTTEDH